MGSFLYFLPGQRAITPRGIQPALERHGLAARLRGVKARIRLADLSDGKGAIVASDELPADRLVFDAEGQTWDEGQEGDFKPFRVGYWNDAKPGPEDLEREGGVVGHEVVLGDSRKWRVPLAHVFPVGTRMPQTLLLRPGGVEYEITPEYRDLCARADTVWLEFLATLSKKKGAGSASMAWVLQLASDALAVNYRVGVAECTALRLFSEDTLPLALEALVDWKIARAFIESLRLAPKKAEGPSEGPCDSGLTSGGGDSAPATSPPTESCTSP